MLFFQRSLCLFFPTKKQSMSSAPYFTITDPDARARAELVYYGIGLDNDDVNAWCMAKLATPEYSRITQRTEFAIYNRGEFTRAGIKKPEMMRQEGPRHKSLVIKEHAQYREKWKRVVEVWCNACGCIDYALIGDLAATDKLYCWHCGYKQGGWT